MYEIRQNLLSKRTGYGPQVSLAQKSRLENLRLPEMNCRWKVAKRFASMQVILQTGVWILDWLMRTENFITLTSKMEVSTKPFEFPGVETIN